MVKVSFLWRRHPPHGFWLHDAAEVGTTLRRLMNGVIRILTFIQAPPRRSRLNFRLRRGLARRNEGHAFLTYLQQLVLWTANRLFPEWADADERRRRSTDMFEWLNALANLVARVSAFLSANETIARFIKPISQHQHEDALCFTADLTKSLICRGVYDAPVVTDDTMAILQHCLQRMLQEGEFKPKSYRAGEVRGFDLPGMIQALLLVSVQGAPGAARFANGDWSDLARAMPLVDAIMQGAGWSAFVMETYLSLCERADSAFPIEAFTGHVINIEVQNDNPQMWSDSPIPARIAGVVQRLAETNYPLSPSQARDLLGILDRLVDMGDRRSAALQQSEYFRGVQLRS